MRTSIVRYLGLEVQTIRSQHQAASLYSLQSYSIRQVESELSYQFTYNTVVTLSLGALISLLACLTQASLAHTLPYQPSYEASGRADRSQTSTKARITPHYLYLASCNQPGQHYLDTKAYPTTILRNQVGFGSISTTSIA